MRNLFGQSPYHLSRRIRRNAILLRPCHAVCRAHERRRRARRGDHASDVRRSDSILNARDLARHKLLQSFQFVLARWIVLQKFARESHRPQRQAHRIQEVSASRQRHFATATAKVKQQNTPRSQAAGRNNSQVNEARFFQPRDNFNCPSGRRAYPLDKCAGVAGIAQCRRRHHSYRVRHAFLNGSIETPQHAHGFGHRLRRKQSATEYAFSQSCDFAILMDLFKPTALQARNFQTHRVRSNINGGKGGHGTT